MEEIITNEEFYVLLTKSISDELFKFSLKHPAVITYMKVESKTNYYNIVIGTKNSDILLTIGTYGFFMKYKRPKEAEYKTEYPYYKTTKAKINKYIIKSLTHEFITDFKYELKIFEQNSVNYAFLQKGKAK